MCVYIYIYTHIHTHTYTYTPSHPPCTHDIVREAVVKKLTTLDKLRTVPLNWKTTMSENEMVQVIIEAAQERCVYIYI